MDDFLPGSNDGDIISFEIKKRRYFLSPLPLSCLWLNMSYRFPFAKPVINFLVEMAKTISFIPISFVAFWFHLKFGNVHFHPIVWTLHQTNLNLDCFNFRSIFRNFVTVSPLIICLCVIQHHSRLNCMTSWEKTYKNTLW